MAHTSRCYFTVFHRIPGSLRKSGGWWKTYLNFVRQKRSSKYLVFSDIITYGDIREVPVTPQVSRCEDSLAYLAIHFIVLRTLFHQEMVANIKQRHTERIYTTDH